MMVKSTHGRTGAARPNKSASADRRKPAREQSHSKGTVDEFQEEGMGVAAKE
jgi:hypothetical protein